MMREKIWIKLSLQGGEKQNGYQDLPSMAVFE